MEELICLEQNYLWTLAKRMYRAVLRPCEGFWPKDTSQIL